MLNAKSTAATLAVTLVSLFAATPVLAAQTIYECRVNRDPWGGWIPTQLVITIDEDTQTATVFDPFIKSSVGKPIPAEYDLRSNGNFVAKWELEDLSTLGIGRVRVIWSAFVKPAKQTVKVTAIIPSASNRPTSAGRCAIKRK